MTHPFENKDSIFALTLLVALLGAYLYFAAPTGPVQVVTAETLSHPVQAAETLQSNPVAQVKPHPPIPVGTFAFAVTVGVIALLVSIGPLVAQPARKR